MREAADRTGIPTGTIRSWINKGLLHAHGHPMRVSLRELDGVRAARRPRPRPVGIRGWLKQKRRSRYGFAMEVAIISAVVVALIYAGVFHSGRLLLNESRDQLADRPQPIVDRPSPDIPWIRFVYDPEHPVPSRDGLRMDICSKHRYYSIEFRQVDPPGSTPVPLFPGPGTPVLIFRAMAGARCDEREPSETVDEKWPVIMLVPGDVIEIVITVFDEENGPPIATFRYRFTMGEHDITGGRIDGPATPVATPIASPIATPFW